jgi:hypothetical protein
MNKRPIGQVKTTEALFGEVREPIIQSTELAQTIVTRHDYCSKKVL